MFKYGPEGNTLGWHRTWGARLWSSELRHEPVFSNWWLSEIPIPSLTWIGKPYSRSNMHVWQTFFSLAHVWHTCKDRGIRRPLVLFTCMIVWRTCYLCFLEPHLRPRAPPEDGEGTRADLAFLAWLESLSSDEVFKKSLNFLFLEILREFINYSELTVFLLGHPDVRIVTKASLAEDWEVCILPVGPVVRVGRQGHRHPGIWFSLWKKECFSLQCSFSPSFVMIQFWNIYCFSKNLCILDITWRTHYKEQIGHNLYVEIEKMPLNLSSCDQSSPFSSPSPFFSGDALPLFDSWDFDLREKLSDFLFQGKQLFTMLGDLICQAPWSPWISILLHGWARPRLGVTLGLKCLKFEGAFMFKWE